MGTRLRIIFVLMNLDIAIKANKQFKATKASSLDNKLPSILQNKSFWKLLEFVGIEFVNASFERNDIFIPNLQTLTIKSLSFALHTIHHENKNYNLSLLQSIIFKSSSFNVLINEHKFIKFHALKIHLLLQMNASINNLLKSIDIKWKGIKLYLNEQTTFFIFDALKQ